jgi:2-keto-4-pentenoate hydratase
MFDARATARRFVRARLDAQALPQYPGALPPTLDDAYACQDAAIDSWPDEVAGWKVGRIPDRWRGRFDEERLIGPIFRRAVAEAEHGDLVEIPVFVGGFAAVEAEFVFCLGADAPARQTAWTAAEAAAVAGTLLVGVEPAGSPLATINELGPGVVVSDFGNNAGLIVGERILDWRARAFESLTCETFIEERSVGTGSAMSIPGGPLAALAFALGRAAHRGRALRAGDYVSTGATSGIHGIRAGESARIVFHGIGEIHCRAVPAVPAEPHQAAAQPARASC